jgi:hypothetical protein
MIDTPVMQLLHHITQNLTLADPTKFSVTTEKIYNAKQKYVAFVLSKPHDIIDFAPDVSYKCYETDDLVYGFCNHKRIRMRLLKWQALLPHAKLYTLNRSSWRQFTRLSKSCEDKPRDMHVLPSGTSTPALSETSVQQSEKGFYQECFEIFKDHLHHNLPT